MVTMVNARRAKRRTASAVRRKRRSTRRRRARSAKKIPKIHTVVRRRNASLNVTRIQGIQSAQRTMRSTGQKSQIIVNAQSIPRIPIAQGTAMKINSMKIIAMETNAMKIQNMKNAMSIPRILIAQGIHIRTTGLKIQSLRSAARTPTNPHAKRIRRRRRRMTAERILTSHPAEMTRKIKRGRRKECKKHPEEPSCREY
jgi:hypothetical protein